MTISCPNFWIETNVWFRVQAKELKLERGLVFVKWDFRSERLTKIMASWVYEVVTETPKIKKKKLNNHAFKRTDFSNFY